MINIVFENKCHNGFLDSMKKIFKYNLVVLNLLMWFVPLMAQTYSYRPTKEDLNNTRERLIDFHSDIDIQIDGTVRVTEYITLYAEGIDIRRGIVRNIPEIRVNEDGREKKIPVKVISLKRNGSESPYHTEYANNDREIFFGSSEATLATGIHQYEFVYETRGHVGFFDDYDELQWNVTGNDWVFTIEHASATLHPPGSSEAIQWSCYTGVYGSEEQAYNCDSNKVAPTFTVTRVLEPYEGFTIAVAFPRDIVVRPTKAELFWDHYGNWIYGGIIVFVSLIVMFIFWYKWGRDAKKMIPMVHFKPPNDWSPATIRYLYKRRFDNKVFAATLLQMAVKGGIKIEEISTGRIRRYSLVPGDKSKLTNGESQLYKELFEFKKVIEITSKNAIYLSLALTELKSDTTSKTPINKYYKDNSDYKTYGCIINVILWLVFSFAFYNFYGDESASFFLIPLIMIVLFLIFRRLIGARTKLGAQTEAELEGFRMYLGTAEKHWLEKLTPPEKTPEHFEEMLPYAIALDVENQWCAKFSNVLKDYTPEWYKGGDISTDFVSTVAAGSFISTFNNSVSKSSRYTSPSSSSSSSGSSSWSSGSSGGGYSGGGGGGGGGRGWQNNLSIMNDYL